MSALRRAICRQGRGGLTDPLMGMLQPSLRVAEQPNCHYFHRSPPLRHPSALPDVDGWDTPCLKARRCLEALRREPEQLSSKAKPSYRWGITIRRIANLPTLRNPNLKGSSLSHVLTSESKIDMVSSTVPWGRDHDRFSSRTSGGKMWW